MSTGTETAVESYDWILDDVGNITEMRHLDGSWWDYVYDDRYRLTSAVRNNRAVAPTTVATYSYGYDGSDNLESKTTPFEDDFTDGDLDGWVQSGSTWGVDAEARKKWGQSTALVPRLVQSPFLLEGRV